jgi:tetratricopeptide (TPR) repeat protein
VATKALRARERILGKGNQITLISVAILALVLQGQGKYSEAEKLNWRALEGYEKELGVQHPDTLTSVYNLAYLLHKQRRYPEAAELYKRACGGYQQKLGSQYLITMACIRHYADMQQEKKCALNPNNDGRRGFKPGKRNTTRPVGVSRIALLSHLTTPA